MKQNEKILHIPKIELGIVIDHIPAGKGIKILEIISKYEEMKNVVVSLGLNYESAKLGKKDLIKLQMEYLSPEIIQHISIMVPGVTIKAIKHYQVHSKVVVKPPQEIKSLLVELDEQGSAKAERDAAPAALMRELIGTLKQKEQDHKDDRSEHEKGHE